MPGDSSACSHVVRVNFVRNPSRTGCRLMMDADLIGESASTVRECREARGHIHVHRIQTIRVLLSYSVVTLEMKKAILVFKLGNSTGCPGPAPPGVFLPVKRHRGGKKTPGGAGTHTGHTGHTGACGHTDHTDESHNHIHPNPTTHPHETFYRYCKTFTHCDSGSLSLVDVCEG